MDNHRTPARGTMTKVLIARSNQGRLHEHFAILARSLA